MPRLASDARLEEGTRRRALSPRAASRRGNLQALGPQGKPRDCLALKLRDLRVQAFRPSDPGSLYIVTPSQVARQEESEGRRTIVMTIWRLLKMPGVWHPTMVGRLADLQPGKPWKGREASWSS
eukprot:352856-Chlamydomonas_euryale.AAC.4